MLTYVQEFICMILKTLSTNDITSARTHSSQAKKKKMETRRPLSEAFKWYSAVLLLQCFYINVGRGLYDGCGREILIRRGEARTHDFKVLLDFPKCYLKQLSKLCIYQKQEKDKHTFYHWWQMQRTETEATRRIERCYFHWADCEQLHRLVAEFIKDAFLKDVLYSPQKLEPCDVTAFTAGRSSAALQSAARAVRRLAGKLWQIRRLRIEWQLRWAGQMGCSGLQLQEFFFFFEGRSWWAAVWDLQGTTALLLCVCSLTLP